MKLEVTERLIWEVPDGSDPDLIAQTYRETYARKVGEPVRVLNGDEWTLLHVDSVRVKKLLNSPW